MLIAGAYISSEDIKDENTFNKLIAEAVSQSIECRWSYQAYSNAQDTNRLSRLVIRDFSGHLYLDVEGSPFPDRTRWTIDQWLGFDSAPASDDDHRKGSPLELEPVTITSSSRISVVIDFNNFMYACAHEICSFDKEDFIFGGWDVHPTAKDVFRFNFCTKGGEPLIPQKVRRKRIEDLMKKKYHEL